MQTESRIGMVVECGRMVSKSFSFIAASVSEQTHITNTRDSHLLLFYSRLCARTHRSPRDASSHQTLPPTRRSKLKNPHITCSGGSRISVASNDGTNGHMKDAITGNNTPL